VAAQIVDDPGPIGMCLSRMCDLHGADLCARREFRRLSTDIAIVHDFGGNATFLSTPAQR
jgi:hypothetical protein